ncbi:hypothetical protein lerEdw1_011409 [Lerista edwardsae]|nr:hypothetical protein lerEdw1_011409 [Lerista edwardsae]
MRRMLAPVAKASLAAQQQVPLLSPPTQGTRRRQCDGRQDSDIDRQSVGWQTNLPLSLCVRCVQNISQSMEVLDLRTYRDLQYVRNTESLMKGLDSKLKVASEKNLNAKSFQRQYLEEELLLLLLLKKKKKKKNHRYACKADVTFQEC